MKARLLLPLVSLSVVLLCGCGNEAGQSPSSANTEVSPAERPRQGEGHAAKDVVPGSHEDWCEEHQVPETQCTRCDRSLIPAFQAANDWDPEHGLPMSQCKIHDPNLVITRPPKPEGN